MIRLMLLLIFMMIGTSAFADWRLPERRIVAGYFQVTGVAANDVLNIRETPSGSSAKIGYLGYDQPIVEVLGTNPSGTWGYVQAGETMGWTSMRYLTPTAILTFGGTDIPIGIACYTTEPFVTYTLGNGHVKIEGMSLATYIVPILNIGKIRESYEVIYELDGTEQRLLLSLATKGSDGMSDVEYQWSFNAGEYYLNGGCTYMM